MRVIRLIEAYGPPPWPASIVAGLDQIFWETAGHPPSNPADREAFRHRWLTSYLSNDADNAFISIVPSHLADPTASPQPTITGYVIGTLATPFENPRFAGLAYFQAFAPLLATYPAHLHINLTAAARGAGTGRALIEAFCTHARSLCIPGVHVVTGAAARNVAFYYGRVGFTERGRTTVNGRELVLLGRDLRT